MVSVKKKEEDAIKDINIFYLAFQIHYFDILSFQDVKVLVFFLLKNCPDYLKEL